MAQMFEGCMQLTDIGNISNWDVSRVTNMWCMFYYTRLGRINLSKWDMSHVTNAGWMFADELAPCIIDMSQTKMPNYHFTVQDFYGFEDNVNHANKPIIVINHSLAYLNDETMPGKSFQARQNSNYLDIYSDGDVIAKIPMDFVFDSEDAVREAFNKATTLDNIKNHLLPGKTLPANADQYSLKLHKLLKDWEEGKTDWNQLFYQVAGSYDLTAPNAPDQPTTPDNPTSPTTPTNPANPVSPSTPAEPDQPTQPSNVPPHPEQPTKPGKPNTKPSKPAHHQGGQKHNQNVKPHAQSDAASRSGRSQVVLAAEEGRAGNNKDGFKQKTSADAVNKGQKQNTSLPQTGQKANYWAFIGLALASLASLLGLALTKKKRN